MSMKIPFASVFPALSHRNCRLFLFSQMISLIGTWMQTVAQQWLVYRLTGSMAMLGMVNLLTVLPLAPLVLWGGLLADRFSRRAIMLITQSAMMILAFVMALLIGMQVVQVWHVLLLAVVFGMVNAVDGPARLAFIAETVDREEDIASVVGLNSVVYNVGRTLGPILAGLVVAVTGEAGAFFVNGASFIVVILSLLFMHLSARSQPSNSSRLVPHLWEAVRYLWSQKIIIGPASLVAISSFLSMPYTILLPVFAKIILSDSARPMIELVCAGSRVLFDCRSPDALTYGLLMTASSLGSVVGALFAASFSSETQRDRWLILCSLSFPVLLIFMALSRSFVCTLFLLGGIGFSFIVQNVTISTLIQLATPDELRGRVLSLYSLAVTGLTRLGGIQSGFIGDAFGAPVAVGAGALAGLVCSVFIIRHYTRWREK